MCLSTFTKKDGSEVPCGRCPQCVARRASSWSFRLLQEHRIANTSYFITLTYDTDNVPISPNGFLTLCKRDCQLFFKNLRRLHCKTNRQSTSNKISYYLVGEYGSNYKRPHYHIIVFNAKLELIAKAWKQTIIVYGSKQIKVKKTIGDIFYGTVTPASVGYCLVYMQSGKWNKQHKRDDRTPEFTLMSKGIGANYFTDAMCRWHKNNLTERMYCNTPEGLKISMPRYYKDKIYTAAERLRISNAFAAKIAFTNYFELQDILDAGTLDTYLHDKHQKLNEEWNKMRNNFKKIKKQTNGNNRHTSGRNTEAIRNSQTNQRFSNYLQSTL